MIGWVKLLGIFTITSLVAASELFAYFDGDFSIQRHFLPNKENMFDWKAYQLPLAWQRKWHTVKNGFQATSGSLSQELFYMKHDIKLQADLHKNFSLLYSQHREEFYKSEPVFQQIEARFGHRYHISVLGYPTYEKRFEDLGVAISYNEPYTMRHVKLTYLNQLASYNEKNISDDRHTATDDLRQTPELLKLDTQYRFFNKLDLILDLKQELEGILEDRTDGLGKSYSGHDYRGTLIWDIDDAWLCGLAFQWREEARSHRPFNPIGAVVRDQQIEHYYLDLFGNVRWEAGELTFGYLDSGFKNTIDAADTTQNYKMHLYSRQLYAKWQRNINHWMKWLFSLQLGTYDYERTGKPDDTGIKTKAGVGLIFYKTERINFLVLTTWAPDSFSDNQWDGGNMQLQIGF